MPVQLRMESHSIMVYSNLTTCTIKALLLCVYTDASLMCIHFYKSKCEVKNCRNISTFAIIFQNNT
uniref:Uncharacterized protein n=1 Tax=Anguilla anguilla TaxID=7936 RepID=A0A0E9XER1_ANGAN